jgi:sugar lactone lactonase YvrE
MVNTPTCQFKLSVRESRPGDDWPEAFPTELSPGTQSLVSRVTDLSGITAAAFSPDSSTVWYVTTPKTLRKYQFRTRTVTPAPSIFVEMKGKVTQLAADSNDQLFAVASAGQRDEILVYDTTKLAPGKRTVEPVDTIAIDGTVARMNVVKNDLYYLCGSMLTRLEAKTRKLLAESKPLIEGARNFCVTPDGKALWVCGDGFVQILDSETLTIRDTLMVSKEPLRLDSIQVAKDGQAFLAGSTGPEGPEGKRVIVALQTNHKTLKQFPWTDPNTQFNAFVLNHDETNLIVSRFDRSPGLVEMYFLTPGQVEVKNTRTYSGMFNAGTPAPSRLWLSPDGQYLLCERGPLLKLPK